MGIRLVGECAKKFAHLTANPYKALIWMCYRTLDDPNPREAIAAGTWFADWPELATAIGWQPRLDATADNAKGREALRNDVSKVCRELVAAGAIEKVPHPNRIDNAAYRVILKPSKAYLDARKEARSKQATRRRRPVTGLVDNVLILDFGTVDTAKDPQGGNHPGGEGGNHPGGEGGNHPGGEGGNHPGPTNRNQEPTEEGVQEGVQEKGEDDTSRGDRPPDRARPVDNSPRDTWAAINAGVRDKLAASLAGNARHARPTPTPIARPGRE